MELYIIDGNSYVYRAYYAIKSLSNSKGFPTNAIFGFTNMLLKIIRDKKPEELVIAFDSPGPTDRHMIYEQYKANRRETPQDLIPQLPFIKKIISAFNIKTFEMQGYEADDLIGTIAKKAESEGIRVYIVTADKDMMQLISRNILVYDPMKDRILDEAYVMDKFGVGPERVTEFMALTGDASDNIPGVKGIGEKTARELLSIFPDIEELIGQNDKISKERIRNLISSGSEMIRLSMRLATIDTEAPIDIDLEEFRLSEPDWVELMALFREFEFTSLIKMLPSQGTDAAIKRKHETLISAGRIREIAESMVNGFAFDTETTGKNALTADLVGISLCSRPEEAFYIPVGHSSTLMAENIQPSKREVLEILAPLFSDSRRAKTGHNLKYDISVLAREGIRVEGPLYDTMLAAYLINPNKTNYGLDEVSYEYLSKKKKPFAEVLKKRPSFAEVPIDEATEYAAEDAALSFELRDILFSRIRELQMEKVYSDIEMPLIPVLAEMEKTGVRIDPGLFKGMADELSREISAIEKRIYFLAGEEFNINSPKQLGQILFGRLGLSPSRKTKTGFSTGMDVLEELAASHELPGEVLQYRSMTKLKTTYIDVMPALVNPGTGRLHTSFNQTAAATGRLSSSEPNLQNIPVRGEWGKRIRAAFIAEEGNLLLSADYSQVELRILAHMSNDETLVSAFSTGLDIHSSTAAELYGVPAEKVTTEMRRVAKTVNFGVIYGISSFGLSGALNIERKEAELYIRQYFDRHPGVKSYIEQLIATAAEQGYVTTMFGRRRPVPELRSSNRNIRQAGERLAVNSPIQGSAADIIKMAMINIRRRFRDESLNARMILQVHDELLFEFPEEALEQARQIIKEEMENPVKLSVPLRVEIGHGKNWADAH